MKAEDEDKREEDKPEEPKLQEVEGIERNFKTNNFAIVADTVGQERMFTFKQRDYIVKTIQYVQSTIEDNEQKALEKVMEFVTKNNKEVI